MYRITSLLICSALVSTLDVSAYRLLFHIDRNQCWSRLRKSISTCTVFAHPTFNPLYHLVGVVAVFERPVVQVVVGGSMSRLVAAETLGLPH